MTGRDEPDVPQEPADGTQAAAPRHAETRSKPEISEPMLDVHAPHQTVHSVKSAISVLNTETADQSNEEEEIIQRDAESAEELHRYYVNLGILYASLAK
jgi:hypothetical protein